MNKKCTKCSREFPLNNTYFFNNKNKKDGFSSDCKECNGYKFADHKGKFKCEDGFKICRKCFKKLPLNRNFYGYEKNRKDGHMSRCLECSGYKYIKQPKEGFKFCIKCDEELILNTENFHVDNSNKDGLDNICKNCKFSRNVDSFNINDWYENKSKQFKDKWSFVDIKWIYDNYLNITKTDLLNYFNNEIKYKTLTNIIYQWNLKKKDKNDNWTKDDIQYLIENYPFLDQKEIEKRFPHRTWDAIKGKASKLNVHRNEETRKRINSESHIGITLSKEVRLKISARRRGSKNWNWKGGVSPIVVRLREYTIPWKLDSLAKYGYVCALEGINDRTLQIHHLNKNFSEIVYEAFELMKLPINQDMSIYTDNERYMIQRTILELHYFYGLGIPLTKKLHKLFHSIYGNKNNTPEQFNEFASKFKNGELAS